MTHRVLVIYDVDGWAYHKRAMALARYAPDDIEITIHPYAGLDYSDWNSKYDLVFLLDYSSSPVARRTMRTHGIKVPLVTSFNRDGNTKHEQYAQTLGESDFVVVNNEHRWLTGGVRTRTCCIPNGVDTEVFRMKTPIEERPHRVLWTGGVGANKPKGWNEVLEPLIPRLKEHGFEVDFNIVREVNGSIRDIHGMVDWYNGASYVLCASSSEGTPNTSLESLACGCVLVSTAVGNVREFGVDRVNCMIAERSPQAFLDALLYAREHRTQLGLEGWRAMQSWSYGAPGHRARYHYQLWRRIISDGAASVRPFSYRDTRWRDI